MQFWKIILGEWFNDRSICHIQRAHATSANVNSVQICFQFLFPLQFCAFLVVFSWFHESFRRSIRWAVGRCNKIPSVENLKLENWLLSRTDFQDVCRCVDERKRSLEKRSMWFEQMKINGNEWKCLGKLCFGGVGSDGKIQGGSVLSMCWWWDSSLSYFPLLFYVSACFSFSKNVKCQDSQEKAEAKAYCRCLSRSCCLSCWRLCYCVLFLRWCSCKWSRAEELHEVLGWKECMTKWPCHNRNSSCWPVRRGRSYSTSVIRYILRDGQQGWNNHLQITSLNPGAWDDLLIDITDRDISMLNKTWLNYHKNISDSLCVLLRERERSDFCLKLTLMFFVSCWHQFAGMFLSFIITTQCQRLKNGADSSKHGHCPMLRPRPVWWGACLRFSRECAVCWDSLLTSC